MKNTIIKTEKLCKSFIIGKTSNTVLKNIDLEIYEGDFTIIMGSSGSGKSTLLYSISTMDTPTSGDVSILGQDITHLNEYEIAAIRKKDISFIFQSMNLLPDLTVFENVAYSGYGLASKEQINQKATDLLTSLDLGDSLLKYPSELSGGGQQRVAIARALISDAKIIFGDEPTGALNSSMGRQVLDILTDLNNKGQSIVMVTHDIKAAARATRLLYLSDGKIAGDLKLGTYIPDNRAEREDAIFQFLKEHNW
ncbi:ABC transporter ATP-binding protein [Anaerosporobacter faecicola]|uniref:ABC transporter ATP-binding protein n=1 Tax=Anaerosporobacter faecicola TaxID=2718714 RepID=UPI00143B423D|nr:ABC transporter ATP-binding protein [Anaerosporobacter faecicola]